MATVRAYEEIVDFIAAGTDPAGIASFRASAESAERVAALLDLEKAGTASPEETSELDHYMKLEHLMRLAKAKARGLMSRG